MPRKTMAAAIRDALAAEMDRDRRVILLGEDVSVGALGVTAGLAERFGPARVMDMPISESAFLGMAVGAAACGLRPVVEIMFADFLGVCFDPLLNQASKLRYISKGRVGAPMVVRASIGAGDHSGPHHSQSLHHLLAAIPGLKVAMPSCPADAAGLLISAMRDPDPVVLLEHKLLYDTEGEITEPPAPVPLGHSRRLRKGRDITLVACGRTAVLAGEAAQRLEKEAIAVDLIDLRSIAPLDLPAITESVARTGRLLVVDEGAARCGLAQDIVAQTVSAVWSDLKAAPAMLTPPHTPVPVSPALESAWLPGVADMTAAARRLCRGSAMQAG